MPDFDIFTHGSPCTSFSRAGKEDGADKNSGTESSLIWYSIEIIKQKKPKYVLWENVSDVLSDKHIHNFNEYINELNELGYNSYYKVINALDYGIPQTRKRIYVVSVSKDIDNNDFYFPVKSEMPIVSLLDILEADAELPILHNIYGGFGETKPRIFNEYSPTIRTSKGGGHIPSVKLKPCIVEDFYKNRDVRVYENYSPTLRATRTGLKVINGDTIRKLTPLECFRLMDESDENFYKVKNALLEKFYKGKDRADSQLYKIAGNSIVKRVLVEYMRILFKDYKNT